MTGYLEGRGEWVIVSFAGQGLNLFIQHKNWQHQTNRKWKMKWKLLCRVSALGISSVKVFIKVGISHIGVLTAINPEQEHRADSNRPLCRSSCQVGSTKWRVSCRNSIVNSIPPYLPAVFISCSSLFYIRFPILLGNGISIVTLSPA